MAGARSGAPDPERATDAAEFVAALQALKDWSGLTYRELTSRAEALGDVLPRSTVANMLARATVPREELVAAFVRACGCDPGDLDTWLRVRKELARGERQAEEAPDAVSPDRDPAGAGAAGEAAHARGSAPAEPPPAPGAAARRPRRRTRVLLPVAGFLLASAAVAAAVGLPGDGDGEGREKGRADGRPAAASGPGPAPAPGAVTIRAVHSGLCLAEDGGQNGQVYQRACAPDSIPRFALKRIEGGWRLVTFHQKFGEGCTGVQDKSVWDGAPVEDQECGKRGPAEAFRLEPVGSPVRGYRLRPLHSDLCVGVEAGTKRAGEPLRQLTCAADAEGQLFAFDRRESAATG
ncbi:helix-turn-helix domain-containing protein [Streptomyces sp. NPDC049597]|uniref:helix-turn-helix domain-containing protein n=1 Tax=Streptomyces sp. NPDC049597 TaxID=3155276 RepID=UPI00341722D2